MSAKDRIFFPTGVNQYVKNCQYASNLQLGQSQWFDLGTPAVASSTGIMTGIASQTAVAKTAVTTVYTADGRYGRTLQMSLAADPGAVGGTIRIHGFDYLNQPMIESFSGANGSTAILYGKKAFYKVTHYEVTVASTNSTTWRIGYGFRLGLPYKCDIVAAKEGGSFVELYKRDFALWLSRGAADAVAGISKWFRSPCPGFVKTLLGIPDGGGSTNDPVITAELGGTAIVGLTVTIDTSDVAGLTVTDAPTTAGYNANNRFITNGLIEIVGAAAASAKGDSVGIIITPTQFTPADTTDPATATTPDPRGTYEALAVYDSLTKVEVCITGDNTANSSDNGGLHGIKHYYA